MITGGQERKSPSVAELQKFVRDKVKIELILANGDKYIGTLRWFDETSFSVVQEYEGPITILRSAVIGYRPAKQ
ncbi:MAG TPA: hypothetical protein V6C72_00755 [Chroococcales cyanobacterium]